MGHLSGGGPTARQLAHGMGFSGCRLWGLCCGFSGLDNLRFSFCGLSDLPADLLPHASSNSPFTGGNAVDRGSVFQRSIGRNSAVWKLHISLLFSLLYRVFSWNSSLYAIHKSGHWGALFSSFPNSFFRCPFLHKCPFSLKMFPGLGSIRHLLALICLSGFDP